MLTRFLRWLWDDGLVILIVAALVGYHVIYPAVFTPEMMVLARELAR